MPPEILSAIVDLAGPGNLPALRLTNKYLCAVSNTPFATLHFSERRHVQSEYSMDALVEITAHSFSGKFVKSVIISNFRPRLHENHVLNGVPRPCVRCFQHDYSRLCKHPDPNHIVLNFERLRGRLNEAFSNIGRHSSSVSVGVCDSTRVCYGSAYHISHCFMSSNGHPANFFVPRSMCIHFVETYEAVFQAAQESTCQIEGTKLYVLRMAYASAPEDIEVQNMIRRFLDSLSATLSFELSLDKAESSTPQHYLKYDHNTGELDLSGHVFERYPSNEFPDADVARMLVRLSIHPVSLRLTEVDFDGPDFLIALCGPTLERLTLHDVTLHSEHFDTNFWSSFLDHLFRTTHLKYLEISLCQYGFSWAENENADPVGDKAWFRTPNGLYQFDPETHDITRFYLAPSGDIKKKIILSDRTSISPQLKGLAEQVAQLEVDKIAEIERENWVRTDIVGDSKDIGRVM
jgi:hypothetical protein